VEPGFQSVLILGLGIAAAVAAVLGMLTVAVKSARARGDWGALAESYTADQEPPGRQFHRHTLQVGEAVYKRSVYLVVADRGLYLRAASPLPWVREPALHIPWHAFGDVRPGWVGAQKAAVLAVGDPPRGTLTLPMRLYDRVRSHLPPPLRRRV
jgi:hypothetical protein